MIDFSKQNKSEWAMVTFGDVVRKVSDRVDPATSGLERYVAGEHMVTDELKITKWGLIGEDYLGPAFHMRFKPGQVLYGSRRTYLRKVALPDFEGITANTTYVLESSDPSKLMPELLPYLMQTELFHAHSIANSKGSVNPYVNYSDIACFKFMLPPLQEQARIVALLDSLESAGQKLKQAEWAANRLFVASLNSFLGKGLYPREYQDPGISDFRTVALDEVASVKRGKFSHRPRNLPEFFNGPYPFVQTADVVAARGNDLKHSQTLSEQGVQYSRSFPANSVLITIAANIGETAITKEETWCTDSVVGIVPSDPSDASYIEFALRYTKDYLDKEIATQTAQKNINLEVLKPLRIPWAEKEQRRSVVEKLVQIENSIISLNNRSMFLKQRLKTSLQVGLTIENV